MATASDFQLINATPDRIAALNLALQYGASNTNVAGMLNLAVAMSPIIMFDPPDNSMVAPHDRGQTLYGHMPDGRPVLLWNPDSAAVVWTLDAAGNKFITGIQSAAQGLFHEVTHLLDPVQQQHAHIMDIEYGNLSERTAVTIEAVIATDMGEPIRNNHDGANASVNNPTLHTTTTEDGALQLVWTTIDGRTEYGPQISVGSPE